MPLKLVLNSEEILNKVFKGSARGYDALAVDQFLDVILKDYQLIEKNVLIQEKEFNDLKNSLQNLETQIRNLEVENGKLKTRLSNIKENDVVTSENINLIKRINKLETFLYQNGFDPNKIR